MGKSIGIDLGTTNSAMAVRVLHTDFIPNEEDELLTPSTVTYEEPARGVGLRVDSQIVVGRKALDRALQNPERTVRSVKRLMGRAFSDAEVQEHIRRATFAYRIAPLAHGTDSSLGIQLRDGEEVTPTQVSAEILKKLKKDAERYLQDEVSEAVITVPAYFNEKQKHATYQAASLAGFKISRLLSEPSAAAIAYGIDNANLDQTILVYDFGGGTLDISILSHAGGHFMEQAKGGDMWLGGDDIDRLLQDFVERKIADEFSIADFARFMRELPSGDRLRLAGEMARAAESAKIRLSSEPSAWIEINSSVRAPCGRIQADFEISRTEFETLIQPLVDRSEELIRKTLGSVDFSADLIDRVLMVGGTSAIPALQVLIRRIFGDAKVLVHPRPMLAIAEGAAILAKKMAGAETNQEVGTVLYRSAHDYYLKVANGEHVLLVDRQTPLPVTVRKTLSYEHQAQRLGHFAFSSRINERFEPIGDLWLSHLPEAVGFDPEKGAPEIEFVFTVTEDELVKVDVKLLGVEEVAISKIISRGAEDQKLYAELDDAIARFNDSVENSPTKIGRVFDFSNYSAVIGKFIAREFSAQPIEPDQEAIGQKVESIRKNLALAFELTESDQGFWERYNFLYCVAQQSTADFEKDDIRPFRALVAKARAALMRFEDQEEIESALSEALEFARERAPMALLDFDPSDAPMSDVFARVRTGINERALSNL